MKLFLLKSEVCFSIKAVISLSFVTSKSSCKTTGIVQGSTML